MKAFNVFIVILALVCLHATGTKLVRTTKEEYLKELNELRRDTAKKYRIPNMHKLFWNDTLAENSLVDKNDGLLVTLRQTWRDSDPLKEVRNLDFDLAMENRSALINEFKNSKFMSELEVLTPGQQEIGCIEWFKAPYFTYCYLVPDGTGNSWNMSQGEPGSACAQGFVNDDGLCSPVIEPTPTAHPTGTKFLRNTKKEYIKDLNKLRRDAAKKYKIPNMYELFWDNALAEASLTSKFTGLWKTQRRIWMDSDPFKEVRNLDSDLAFDNRTALMKEFGVSWFMSEIEVLIPGQQRIGCIPWKRKYDYDGFSVSYFTYCLLEPEGTGNSWNMTQGEPGSVCASGFENNDGLCSPARPTTPTPEPATPTPEPTTPKPKTPQPKIVGPKPTAPPKASRLGSDSESEPAQDSNQPTDGASYGQVGMTLLLLISMIF
ncbi:hypothetical protein B9Z55_012182 [Caenorhabditis nigoni]|uniref:SCP domain-containing protein n=1 Tax=Caenorhabditis nigoni TaxID=1611254 RepID=A0A2G5TW10_9PELO|nr:hypothetical protein B9Z55_012182 [Caenorhabditis nigoni]